MAAGDIVFFEEFVRTLGEEKHNFSSDTIKVGLVTNGVTPAAADATPTWSDYSGSEVSTAGGYTADGETLTTVTWTEAGGIATLDADSIALSQNGSGFTNAYWAIIYNDSSADDDAIAYVDLGGPVSEQAGEVNINWNPGGIIGTESAFGTDWWVEQTSTASELATIAYSSGVPSADATAGATTGGSGSHTANRSGSYEAGNGDSLAEVHDWSSSTRGDWATNMSHRSGGTQTGAANGLSILMTLANASPITALGTSDKLYCEFVGSAMTTNTAQSGYIRLFNSSGHWVRAVFIGDASQIKKCNLQYYNGSTTYSGSQVGVVNIGNGTYNLYQIVWDGNKTTDIDAYYNETQILTGGGAGPDMPAEFPGWSSFGNIASMQFFMFAPASTGLTPYMYTARASINGAFG